MEYLSRRLILSPVAASVEASLWRLSVDKQLTGTKSFSHPALAGGEWEVRGFNCRHKFHLMEHEVLYIFGELLMARLHNAHQTALCVLLGFLPAAESTPVN
jgi:hypothetical protein